MRRFNSLIAAVDQANYHFNAYIKHMYAYE